MCPSNKNSDSVTQIVNKFTSSREKKNSAEKNKGIPLCSLCMNLVVIIVSAPDCDHVVTLCNNATAFYTLTSPVRLADMRDSV